MIIVIFWMSLALFGSTQSVSFQCQYNLDGWGFLGTLYYCNIVNAVSITSPDAAQIDSISGTHQFGRDNDNVEAFNVENKGQINYFPRGLNKFFKNLKAIQIYNNVLKEIHQRDLKDFPKLMGLSLRTNNLEILEENLFEFNPNLEFIDLWSNKITHIDPHVFSNLIKLHSLFVFQNPCISMYITDNSTAVQNIIRAAQLQCTNLVYSNLEQQVKYLEFESQFSNPENLKEKLENLENQIKNSKFSNFFRESLKGLNATVLIGEAISKINDVNAKLIAKDSKLSEIEEQLDQIIELINNN